MLLSDALAVAVETLSWMEIEGLSERQALARSSNQLGIKDLGSLRLAQRLVLESTRRQNLIEKLLELADPSLTYQSLKAGPRSFARIYTYWTVVKNVDWNDAVAFLKAGRKLLGWRELAPLELTFGKLLGFRPESALTDASDSESIALKTFHPKWYVEYCVKMFGRSNAIAILNADKTPPPTYIRVNTLAEDESTIVEKMKRDGIELDKIKGMKYVYGLSRSRGLPPFSKFVRSGEIQVQDKSSCYTALAAKPKPGSVVFDVCAAPGAKTSFLAQLMRNRGTIYSFDISERRIAIWKKEMKRMRVNIAQPFLADARQSLPLNIEADVLVLDPPCSNSGTFAKTPSAKWRIKLTDFKRFSQIQLQMLNQCANQVRLGGRLVYSTCSISVEENEKVIETFLGLDPRFSLVEIEPEIGKTGMKGLSKCRRLYPQLDECNGYFLAAMIRKAY